MVRLLLLLILIPSLAWSAGYECSNPAYLDQSTCLANGGLWRFELDQDDNNAQDLNAGGTNATTAAEARTNLGITPVNIGAEPTQTPVTQSEAEVGTVTSIRSWSPLRVAQAIAALTADNVSVTGAEVNGSGHLVITLSDSTTIDAGSVVGPSGDEGLGVASATVDGSGHLILTMTDDSTVDAGAVVGGEGPPGDSGVSSLLAATPEGPGINCTEGGQKISFGQDDDLDAELDESEVDGYVFVCNGTGGEGGGGTWGTIVGTLSNQIDLQSALDAKEPVITVKGTAFNKNFGAIAGTVTQGNDSRLSDARTPTAHKTSHATGGTDALAPSDIGAISTTTFTGHTTPATVPDPHTQYMLESNVGTGPSNYVQLNASSQLPAVSGALLTNLPGGAWGSITGTLSSQTDLNNALAGKEPNITKLTAFNKGFGTGSDEIPRGNDSRFTDARTPTAHKTTHATGQADALAPSDIGAASASDLTNHGAAADPHAGYMLESNIGTTAGKYLVLDGSGRIPAVNGSLLTNLPTGAWGGITGTLSNQTDLNAALAGKETANANIQSTVTSYAAHAAATGTAVHGMGTASTKNTGTTIGTVPLAEDDGSGNAVLPVVRMDLPSLSALWVNGTSVDNNTDGKIDDGFLQSGRYVATPWTYSDEACTAGEYALDENYIYTCIASGNINRTALTDWNNPQP